MQLPFGHLGRSGCPYYDLVGANGSMSKDQLVSSGLLILLNDLWKTRQDS